jgi:hypothetical protein
MSDDTRRILDLLASGKVTVDEADRLLDAIGAAPVRADPGGPAAAGRRTARFLRIAVQKPGNECRPERQVTIRVPLSMVRSGMRLGAMIPGYGEAISERLRQRGIGLDLSKLGSADFEAALKEMGELDVDVDHGKAKVRISCE